MQREFCFIMHRPSRQASLCVNLSIAFIPVLFRAARTRALRPGGSTLPRPGSAKVLARFFPLARVAPQSKMKNNKQNSILMGVTAVCVVASLILCGMVLKFNRVISAAQEIQTPAREMQRAQIARIAQELGIKPKQ